MALAHPTKNTDKYECVNCTSDNVSIIRESENPRLKCNSCQFMFNATDFHAAKEAGAIKPSSAEALAEADEPERITYPETGLVRHSTEPHAYIPLTDAVSAPKTPSHLFLSKDRLTYELCTKSSFKKTAIIWSDRKYDVYELKRIKLNVKVDITG